ncbi:MAG: aspartate aminotransferase family protein [Rhodothermales bacterium]|nr:aspartate aminotransferase family protein [Rhodothermales bacterium]MBO6780235.1 aspartate aminotransferase family protein [Rhodothermales bacterium]
MELDVLIGQAVREIRKWERGFGAYDRHPSTQVDADELLGVLKEYTQRLHDNYPFFHPRYAAQMLKPPHPAAIAGYVAAMMINPNAHALDGGPATSRMEFEVMDQLAAMFGFKQPTLGHLTSSGTIANLEALFVARELHPDKTVAFSQDAHYTHARMCHVLGVKTRKVPTDAVGRMDVLALRRALQDGNVGTVVATAGTTGQGLVDPIEDIVAACSEFGVRVHVDAAYGGFYCLLADSELLEPDTRRHYKAISGADSVVVDPHKHGLQPYGCGAILFADPKVGKFYKHDSPYTYFTSDQLHLGEISLECSRPGAAAGAFWMTLKLLPLTRDGLGDVLAACRRAALGWYDELQKSSRFDPVVKPELDIVTFFPSDGVAAASAISEASQEVFERTMAGEDPLFLSTLRVPTRRVRVSGRPVKRDKVETVVLRAVLMKPEMEGAFDERLHGLKYLAEV